MARGFSIAERCWPGYLCFNATKSGLGSRLQPVGLILSVAIRLTGIRQEIVFKDGVGYDPAKLLNSVRGIVGIR